MEETMLIKKHMLRPYLNRGTKASPEWVQIKKAVEFTRALNPQIEDRDYISDEHPTTELMDYKPSFNIAVTTYKGEPDFDMFYEKYKALSVGAEARSQCLLVNMFDSVQKDGKEHFFAEVTDVTVVLEEWNATSNQISGTIYENGTPEKGYVTIEAGNPTFTKGEMPSADEAV